MTFSPSGSVLAATTAIGIELWDTWSFTSRPSRAADWDGDGQVGFGDFVILATGATLTLSAARHNVHIHM
ncbi:MAG: hypothetical protein OXH06_11565 [Gemmatimonadetes bacterium]|nr:hypothetical protein [Gemmatimonadota bacterium]